MATVKEVYKLANDLLDQHGLSVEGWRVEFTRGRTTMGQCVDGERLINLSVVFIEARDIEAGRDTILHEIAHALTPGHGHDIVWKLKCQEIGAIPEARHSDQELLAKTALWTGTCPNGHRTYTNRMTKRAREGSCRECSRFYNPNYRFTWERNR